MAQGRMVLDHLEREGTMTILRSVEVHVRRSQQRLVKTSTMEGCAVISSSSLDLGMTTLLGL